MAISNQECIDYLEGWERLSKMDPKLRKIIVDRAVKGIKALDQSEKAAKEDIKRSLKIKQDLDIIRALANRSTALTVKELNDFMTPEFLSSGKPVPELIFLKNILLILCEISKIDFKNLSNDDILENIIFLYMSALKPLCRYNTGGAVCAFCDIDSCELSKYKTPEEKEKMRKKIEEDIENEVSKDD